MARIKATKKAISGRPSKGIHTKKQASFAVSESDKGLLRMVGRLYGIKSMSGILSRLIRVTAVKILLNVENFEEIEDELREFLTCEETRFYLDNPENSRLKK